MIKWFAANNLVLNLDKMNKLKFILNNSLHSTQHVGYKEKSIERLRTKFLVYKLITTLTGRTILTNWFLS
jgi:hypothetical protein